MTKCTNCGKELKWHEVAHPMLSSRPFCQGLKCWNEYRKKNKSRHLSSEQEYFNDKLSSINTQLIWNGVIVVAAVLYILFMPLAHTTINTNSFPVAKVEFDLLWIVAFIVMIVGIARAFTLRSKRKEAELDLEFNENKRRRRK